MDEGQSIWRDYCKMGFKNSEGFEQAEKNSKTILKNMKKKKNRNPRKKMKRMKCMNRELFLSGQNDFLDNIKLEKELRTKL